MANDPLYHDKEQFKRMAADRQIMERMIWLRWPKLVSGLVALALIAAIWLVWRLG